MCVLDFPDVRAHTTCAPVSRRIRHNGPISTSVTKTCLGRIAPAALSAGLLVSCGALVADDSRQLPTVVFFDGFETTKSLGDLHCPQDCVAPGSIDVDT